MVLISSVENFLNNTVRTLSSITSTSAKGGSTLALTIIWNFAFIFGIDPRDISNYFRIIFKYTNLCLAVSYINSFLDPEVQNVLIEEASRMGWIYLKLALAILFGLFVIHL
jgi:hypothetical protein